MLSIAQKALNLYAPPKCIGCGREGNSLCAACLADIPKNPYSRCFMCGKWSSQFATCGKCRRKTPLKNVWVAAEYSGNVKELIHDFKYERDRSAVAPLAEIINRNLPYLEDIEVITHVPTATSRVRTRGYDHSKLLAQELSRKTGIRHKTLVGRLGQSQQMGEKRTDRLKNAKKSYVYTRNFSGSVLLVDDVLTTGATLSAVAKQLKKAGAKKVFATVVAHHSSN